MDRHFLNRVYAKLFRILTSIGVAQRITVTLLLRVGGRRFRIPVVQSVGLRNVTHGDWWLQDILSKLLPDCPGTFLDVGANVGQTLLKVKGCSPDRAWLGFEPNPTCVMYLERLIALNQFKSCTLIPAALDKETGVKALDCFHTDASDDTASLVKNFRANEKVIRRSWVPVVEFSALGRAGIDEAIGFVKIDVEGAEKEVLESLHAVLVKFRPFIVLEILPVYNEENQERLARQRAVEKQLHNLDYIVCRVEKDKDGHCIGLRSFPEIGIHDQLTWSDYLLVPSEKLDETFEKIGRAYHAGSRDGEMGHKAKIDVNPGNDSNRSLAIIGCGAVVEEFYEPALKNLEGRGWTLNFVDAAAKRAQETATRFRRAAAFGSIGAIIGRASHAIVATPPASHFSLCNQLLEAGIHVLCEKPFVLDSSEGQALVDRAAGADLKLYVNQTRRWFPASLAARRLLCEEAIGDVTSISARFGTRFDWPTKTAFHSHPGLARTGILSDQGAHIFDLISWILDRELEPIDVKHDGYAGPEMTVCVDFSSGPVRGNAIMTWLVVVPSYVHFVGTKGRIILDDDCNRALLQRESEILEVAGTCRYSSYASIATDLLAAFVDGTDNASVAPAKSVLPSTTFLDRAYRMATATLPRVTALG